MSEPAPTLPLAERILAVMKDLGPIEATGKTPFDKAKPALSIGDVEKALRPLLVKHGITIWPRLDELTLSGALWRSDMTFKVESFDIKWADVGSSPSAAMSFCRKSFYKALFHIADMGDEDGQGEPAGGTRRPARRASLSFRTADEVEALYALGAHLPKVATQEQIIREIEAVGVEEVSARLRAAHLKQCGSACPHLPAPGEGYPG